MRGKVPCKPMLAPAIGITPAHAGKSHTPFQKLKTQRDHPRTCGEKPTESKTVDFDSGSPPHMRGKECPLGSGFIRLGITPAHAGKRFPRRAQGPCRRDHPRTCGEKLRARDKISAPWGSPPHMRGKEKIQHLVVYRRRITPAHAGKRIEQRIRDYVSDGSPPHMRGKVCARQS